MGLPDWVLIGLCLGIGAASWAVFMWLWFS
jgi:hypothetical protein